MANGAFLHAEASPTEIYEAVDNVIITDGTLDFLVNDLLDNAVTMTVLGVTTNNAMTLTDDTTNRQLVAKLMPGQIYWKDNLSDYGVITNVSYNGTAWVVQGTHRVTIAGGEVFRVHPVARWDVRGNKVIGKPNLKLFRQGRLGTLINQDAHGMGRRQHWSWTVHWPVGGSEWYFSFQPLAYIERIRVRVQRKYSGTGTAPEFWIQCHDGVTADQIRVIIPLTAEGYVETGIGLGTPYTDSSGITASTLTALTKNQKWRDFKILCMDSFAVFAATDPGQMPIIHLDIDAVPIVEARLTNHP
jgi:hypothetical protein